MNDEKFFTASRVILIVMVAGLIWFGWTILSAVVDLVETGVSG
jgi:hypothetical protein